MSLFYTGCVVPHVSDEAHSSSVRCAPELAVQGPPREPPVEGPRFLVLLDDPEVKRGSRTTARDPSRGIDHQSPSESPSLPRGKHVEIVEERAPRLVLVEDHANEPDGLGVARGEKHESRGGVMRGELLLPDRGTVGEHLLVEVLLGKEPTIGAPPALRVKPRDDRDVVWCRAADVPGIDPKLFAQGIEVPEDPEALELSTPRVEQGGAGPGDAPSRRGWPKRRPRWMPEKVMRAKPRSPSETSSSISQR